MQELHIQTLLVRLGELQKNYFNNSIEIEKAIDVAFFLHESGFEDEYNPEAIRMSLKNEMSIEYETIVEHFKLNIAKEISEKSSAIFSNFNHRDFDLKEVENKLNSAVNYHFYSRSELEIKRDNLLNITDYYYRYCYKQSKEFIKLIEIDKERHQSNVKVQKAIIDEFEKTMIDELNANKIQKYFKNEFSYSYLNDEVQEYLDSKAIEFYNNRNETVKERDTFSFITLYDYQKGISSALKNSLEHFQLQRKTSYIESISKYFEEEINSPLYQQISDWQESLVLRKYISYLIENRKPEEVTEDEFRLIDINECMNCGFIALENIKNKYPYAFYKVKEERTSWMNDYTYIDCDSKYEKYDGYNGYDDDTIDDAFEGDPSNTWNVD